MMPPGRLSAKTVWSWFFLHQGWTLMAKHSDVRCPSRVGCIIQLNWYGSVMRCECCELLQELAS
jgi:hypothetical protein